MAHERRRLELHEKLCELLGSTHVYYQPPDNVQMKYPCIVYHPNPAEDVYADNKRYIVSYSYHVQIIAHDPEYPLFDSFPDNFMYCTESAPRFESENLNHVNYKLYY